VKRETREWVNACAATRAHGSEVPKHATDILDSERRLKAEVKRLRGEVLYAQGVFARAGIVIAHDRMVDALRPAKATR